MSFTIDFRDGRVLEWRATDSGAKCYERDDYTPTIYASASSDQALADIEAAAAARGDVAQTTRESWRPAFRRDPETICRLDVTAIDRVRPVAGWIRRREQPGTYRLFNVDFSPEFRYCLERGRNPVPERSLRTLELTAPGPGNPGTPVERLSLDGERVEGSVAIAETRRQRLTEVDPDALVVSEAALVPALTETAAEHGHELRLGRRPGYEQLATASTYEHYGQVAHSPARYSVPGRVLIDRSNTFFYEQANLAGCLDLVERSGKPLQELSWASIGNVLTAIQIREALARGVLVPWQSWRHEFPKTMRQLHEADRGGFTFSPEVGVHEQVHELDFSSLYPNIICTRNISPETIRCPCHDTDDVPGLGYSICPEPGYLPDVLQPIINDRDEIKSQLKHADAPDRIAALEGQSAALKWILVSCFGYQGFSNAKFGRIECHEVINAFARQILLDAKARLEQGGWRVVHGIVDSLWVTAREGATQQPLDQIVDDVTEATEIRLEYEGEYDWIAFVPRRDDDAGALTTYFGRRTDGSYKYRGIECRQRSTSEFVADCQRSLIERFDRTRSPDAVCLELSRWIRRLEAGTVAPEQLAITVCTSKPATQYQRRTRTTAALERFAQTGIDRQPGQDVQYVVVDDDRNDRDRVRLAHEPVDSVDTQFYREQLLRAGESVLSPSGWRVEDIEATLHDHVDTSLSQFG